MQFSFAKAEHAHGVHGERHGEFAQVDLLTSGQEIV